MNEVLVVVLKSGWWLKEDGEKYCGFWEGGGEEKEDCWAGVGIGMGGSTIGVGGAGGVQAGVGVEVWSRGRGSGGKVLLTA